MKNFYQAKENILFVLVFLYHVIVCFLKVRVCFVNMYVVAVVRETTKKKEAKIN